MGLMTMDWMLLFRLLIAHWLTDFVLQTESKAREKTAKKWCSPWLYWHGAIAGILGYLLAGHWSAWWLFPLLAFTHIVIDFWKSSRKDSTSFFVMDQLLHLIVLCIAWLLLANNGKELAQTIVMLSSQASIWILLTAYLAILWPTGVLISKALDPWQKNLTKESKEGLENAGRWIGFLERVLILTFVLLQRYEVIGFLVAAKSLFRFPEISKSQDREKTEYFIIGTFLSITVAVAIGLLAKWILQQYL